MALEDGKVGLLRWYFYPRVLIAWAFALQHSLYLIREIILWTEFQRNSEDQHKYYLEISQAVELFINFQSTRLSA